MSTTDYADLRADPLASSIAFVLRVPLIELYALLWRVGVLEIRPAPARAAACSACPNRRKPGSARQSRPSPRRRHPAPVPSRPDPAECSRAAG
ncbi:Rv1535 domain-containing protein [Mycobacterium palustre]|uniref:Rv1535 domain-containing protein n=1 Tax=Mycobacterium palustre TaxID=153971 RepID=UPI001FEC7E29|nr:Rv1535 domain-containing protein [Mycobacterium palustre]